MTKNRPKWGKVNKLAKRSLTEVATSLVKYMELAKASREYLKKTNRINPSIDFRLLIEAEFCQATLEYLFKVTKAFVANTQKSIHDNEKEFKEEVKQFSDGIIPEVPLIVTKNLEGEMGKIIQHGKVMKEGKFVLK